jgi:hypothetical protein
MQEKRRRDIAAEVRRGQDAAMLAIAIAAAQSDSEQSRDLLHSLQFPERIGKPKKPSIPQPGLFSLFDIMPVEPTVVRIEQES